MVDVMAMPGEVWEVVGGTGSGGIIVRQGRDLASPKVSERLAAGSHVEVLEVSDDGRLHYKIHFGSGPVSGWVSAKHAGKSLLVKRGEAESTRPQVKTQAPVKKQGASNLEIVPSQDKGLGLVGGAGMGNGDPRETMRLYCRRFAQDPAEDYFDFTTKEWRMRETAEEDAPETSGPQGPVHPIHGRRGRARPGGAHCNRKLNDGSNFFAQQPPPPVPKSYIPEEFHQMLAFGAPGRNAPIVVRDSDGADVRLCPLCRLPMGTFVRDGDEDGEGGTPMHGECKAQLVLHRLRLAEETRLQQEEESKAARRREYKIGWTAARIPRNLGVARIMECNVMPTGMVCLVWDEGSTTVRLAPTFEPAAAVNLEYLLIALQVRRSTGGAPQFSLEPVFAEKHKIGDLKVQKKRFSPEWLAGTSVGEVMFQADYHLKELSMGEYDQPVIGMKSCFDFSVEEGFSTSWDGREWFMVRKGEVLLSDDDVLVPYVKIGIEAREQQVRCNALWDSKITRPDHPLVRYAEQFTRNFDLIAERKSVMHQLREVVKATALAKFLIEADLDIKESWFNLLNEDAPPDCAEIPQLWNERCFRKICVRDGRVDDAIGSRCDGENGVIGVYGGVETADLQYGPPAPSAPLYLEPGQQPQQAAAAPGTVAVAPHPLKGAAARRKAMSFKSRRGGPRLIQQAVVPTRALVPAAVTPKITPKGVDLNLDQFEMLDANPVSGNCVQSMDTAAPVGEAFWSSVFGGDESKSMFKEVDKRLLLKVFNPHLSDRRREGLLFTPPVTSGSYVDKLRVLVASEEEVKTKRKDHFLSTEFALDDAGPLFPSSWTSSFEVKQNGISGKELKASSRGGVLRPCPDRAPSREALKSAKLIFDKRAEDGTRFRIYRPGSIEVRTIQEHDSDELVGVVFSIQASAPRPAGDTQDPKAMACEPVDKVTVFVEAAGGAAAGLAGCRFYAVLETGRGNVVVTERLEDGSTTWQENPAGVAVRNSLAKVFASSACAPDARATLEEMGGHRAAEAPGPCEAACKRYAMGVYHRAGGAPLQPPAGPVAPQE